MTEPSKETEATARTIWENLAGLMGDYSEVPFEQIMRRPRYAGIRGMLFRTAEALASRSPAPADCIGAEIAPVLARLINEYMAVLDGEDAPQRTALSTYLWENKIGLLRCAEAAPADDGAEMRAFGASHVACFKWPDDTAEHRAARAAYCQGAADAAPADEGETQEDVDREVKNFERRASDFADGHKFLLTAPAQIKLPPPTPDQEAYLRKIADATGKYDPNVMVGGPSKRPAAPADRAEIVDLSALFKCEPREGGYQLVTAKDFPGFTAMLHPGERLTVEHIRSLLLLVALDSTAAARAEIVEECAKYKAALQQIIAEADSDDGLTAWDGSDIAREALASEARQKEEATSAKIAQVPLPVSPAPANKAETAAMLNDAVAAARLSNPSPEEETYLKTLEDAANRYDPRVVVDGPPAPADSYDVGWIAAVEVCAKVAEAASAAYFERAQELFGKEGEGRANARSDAADEIAAKIRSLSPAPAGEWQKALEDAAIFLEVGASYAPNDGLREAIQKTGERLKTRGLADTMKALAKHIRAMLSASHSPPQKTK